MQGIPDGIRVDVWLALSGVDEIRARILEKSKLTGKEYYNSLVARAERELSEQLQDQIDRDLPRTFPKHKSIFNTKAGQPVLRRVLFAYAVHDKVLGYCQSLNFVAAFFLCFADEEYAFWLLYAVTQKLCPGYYVKSMISIRADSNVIGNLIDQDLKDHIEEIHVPLQGVCVASLMQLYILKLPTKSVLRLFDFLFLEGSSTMILCELFLFKQSKESLLKCTGIVEFSAALAETESTMYVVFDLSLSLSTGENHSNTNARTQQHRYSADELIRGIIDEMNHHGGMERIQKLQSESRQELERNDLQILHDELSSEINSLPESDLSSPTSTDTRRASTSSVVSSSSSSTSSSRARYMSDDDFESLYNSFNRVAVDRVRSV